MIAKQIKDSFLSYKNRQVSTNCVSNNLSNFDYNLRRKSFFNFKNKFQFTTKNLNIKLILKTNLNSKESVIT